MVDSPDSAASVDFLKKIYPKGPWVLTSIQLDNPAIETRTFTPDTLGDMMEWLKKYNGQRNIYWSVNPPLRPLTKKAEREDIKEVALLHVDLDPRKGMDIADEQKRIAHLLQEGLPESVPKPTAVVFSGGGYQAFWKLQEPIPINGNLDRAIDAARYNQQLELIFVGADATHNIDRICRLPGTINLPNALKRKKGRQPALSTLVAFDPELVYPLSAFTPAAMVQAKDDILGRPSLVKISGNIERLESIDELSKWGVPDRVKVICVQGSHPDEPPKQGDNSRSAWLFDVLCQLVRSGVPDEVIYSVVTDPDFAISESVLDKGSNVEKYALRQIQRAKEEADDPWLRKLNDQHAVISNIGGKVRVIEEQWDATLNRHRISKQTFEDFRNRYMNKYIELGVDPNGKPIRVTAGKWWLSHPQRRQFEGIIFAPNKDIKDMYNLWRGFSCDAIPGDCSLLLEHLRKNVCLDNEEHYNYLIGWCANAVQHPDSPGQVAIVMRGPQGVGKSFFATHFGSLFGRHFLQVSDPKHLVGSFNAHLRDCVVLFGDEAFYAGDKKHESILKTLITEETILVENKGVDAEVAPNYTHIMMASNSQWVIPAGGGERRYLVLDVGKDKMQDTSYFKRIEEQWNSGGKEAFLHFLMKHDLAEFDVRAVPKTTALHEQKLLSMTTEEEWWYNKLVEGRLLFKSDDWQDEVMKDEMLSDYLEYTRRLGIQRRSSATSLGKFLQRVMPGQYPSSYQRKADIDVPGNDGFTNRVTRRVYFYRMPTLAECREHWDSIFGASTEWDVS